MTNMQRTMLCHTLQHHLTKLGIIILNVAVKHNVAADLVQRTTFSPLGVREMFLAQTDVSDEGLCRLCCVVSLSPDWGRRKVPECSAAGTSSSLMDLLIEELCSLSPSFHSSSSSSSSSKSLSSGLGKESASMHSHAWPSGSDREVNWLVFLSKSIQLTITVM